MSSSLLNKILSSAITSTPASNRAPENSSNHEDDDNDSSSCFQRTVCLYDWWLVKAEKDFQGKRLAVAGFTSREQQAMRVFTSAPIAKRYDIFTLESADGICIVVKGFINKLRTLGNGFSSEVFTHFLFGFPPCWEVYNEKCLGKELTTATGSSTFPDFNKSASVPKHVAGVSNSIPTTTPSKHSENLSERVITNSSTGPDSPNHTAECNDIDKTNTCTLDSLPPSLSCDTNTVYDINTISSLENNLAVRAEPSTSNATESSKRVANLKNSMESNKGTVRKSKTKQPAHLESFITTNAGLEESPVPKNSVYNHFRSNMGPDVSRENSDVEFMATSSIPKTSEKQKENDKSEDVLSSRLGVRHKDSVSTFHFGGDPDFSNCVVDGMTYPVLHSAKNIDSVTSSKVDINAVNTTPSNSGQKTRYWLRNLKGNQEENSEFGGYVKHKSKRLMSEASEVLDGENSIRYGLRNLKSNWKEHSRLRGSVKYKRKEFISEASEVLDGENLKGCSSRGTILSGRKTNILEITQSQSVSRIFRSMLENLKGQEKESRIVCGLEVNGNKTNSSSVMSYRMRKIVKNVTLQRMNVFNFCDDDLREPIHNTVMKEKSKQRQDSEKISLCETSRQKSNNLTQSPNGLGDAIHSNDLRTAASEKDRNSKNASSSRKKTRRKINFDAHASPLTKEREAKVSIISPDSLSLKRSRSGRLLLPSLEFWRNQVAVYDADRKITGIQEAVDDVKLYKGSKSEPRKKVRFNG